MSRDKVYPLEQEVECALPDCGASGTRIITGCMQRNNLWYCCSEHKADRLLMVRRGLIPASSVWANRKKVTDKSPSKPSKHRKSVEDIKAPTDYENQLWGC